MTHPATGRLRWAAVSTGRRLMLGSIGVGWDCKLADVAHHDATAGMLPLPPRPKAMHTEAV